MHSQYCMSGVEARCYFDFLMKTGTSRLRVAIGHFPIFKGIPSGDQVALKKLGGSLPKQLYLGSPGSVLEDNWLVIYMHPTSSFPIMGDIQLEGAWNLPLILAGENNDMTSSLKATLNSLAKICSD